MFKRYTKNPDSTTSKMRFEQPLWQVLLGKHLPCSTSHRVFDAGIFLSTSNEYNLRLSALSTVKVSSPKWM